MTSQGLEEYRKTFLKSLSASAAKDITFGNNLMTAFKFDPIFGDQTHPETVTGTRVVFVSWSDFGGSVPKSIVQRVAPKAIAEFYDEIVQTAKKIEI